MVNEITEILIDEDVIVGSVVVKAGTLVSVPDDISLEHAEKHLSAGRASIPGQVEKTPDVDPAPPEGDAKIDAIINAIRQFSAHPDAAIKNANGDEINCWNQDGETPNVNAIEAALGYDITADERTEAVFRIAEGDFPGED